MALVLGPASTSAGVRGHIHRNRPAGDTGSVATESS
jgi:hypothetical protein